MRAPMNPTRCVNGHLVPDTHPYCPTCGGTVRVRSRRVWLIAGGAAASLAVVAILLALLISGEGDPDKPEATPRPTASGNTSPTTVTLMPTTGAVLTPGVTPASAAAATTGLTSSSTQGPTPAPTQPSARATSAPVQPNATSTPVLTASGASIAFPTPIPPPLLIAGTSVHGNFASPGQVALYRFEAKEMDAVYIAFAGDTSDLNFEPKLELFSPDGEAIRAVSSVRGCEYYGAKPCVVTIDTQLPEAGTYTIRGSSSGQQTGGYVLAFSQLSELGGIPVSAASTQGELTSPGDVNWYVFNAESGDSVFISLADGAEGGGPFYPFLELLGPDGELILFAEDNLAANIDRQLTQTGKYTIRVRDYRRSGGPYILSFSLVTQ